MIKYYCDLCEKEIKQIDCGRVVRVLNDLKIEVLHTYKGAANGGNVCHECVIKTVVDGTRIRNA